MSKAANKQLAIIILLVLLFINPVIAKVLAYETFAMSKSMDLLVADFEGDDYGDWQVTGQAFGEGPAKGTLPGQMDVSGFMGKQLVNSFYNGDTTTGTLTSPEFTVERSYINFLIGGGGYPGETCMNLIMDGQVVRSAVGPNTVSGGSEHLDWQSWNVVELKGKTVKLQIIDQRTGGWGHINVDQIMQSDTKRELVNDYQRTFTVEHKYLNFPVKNSASKRWINLFVDGVRVRQFDIELATSEPDFWVYLDVSEFQGKEVAVEIDKYSSSWEYGFDAVTNADTFPGEETVYKEKLRPQFHFSSKRGWNNDTNGMVYHDGLYHLFYQHNPFGWNWGNMTWGHAVSRDMVHWQEWGDALHPDEMGTIYSGSAVVDHNNTSGLQTGGTAPIIAFYTSAGGNNVWSSGQPFTQSMAYSNDGGHTWEKYADNPVIGKIAGGTRDPKVFWHEPTETWVMIIWIDGSKLAIFNSTDLKTWQKKSEVDGFFECPELFELALDGDANNTKWIVYGADGNYKVGDFNGTHYTFETETIKFEYGNCFYASQTFNDIPASDGRRVQMVWGRVSMPGMPFNQMVMFPVTLTLHSTADGPRMFVNPVREIESLHQQHWSRSDVVVKPGQNPLSDIQGELFHVKATLRPQGASVFKMVIRGVSVEYNVTTKQLSCQGKTAPLELVDGQIELEILVDRMSIEIFANGGKVYMPIGVNLTDNAKSLEFESTGGDTKIDTMDIYELKSIWF